MSVIETLEALKESICDSYCKYPCMEPPEGKDENWLADADSPCQSCPLMEL